MRQMGIEPKATARWRARLVVMVAGETKLAEHGAYIVLLQLRPVLLAHVAERALQILNGRVVHFERVHKVLRVPARYR